MALFSNTLSWFVIAFLPRSKYLLISWLQSPSTVILEPKKKKSVTVSPSTCHEVVGLDAMILIFWMLNFKPAFWLYSFTFIKRLFNSSLLIVIRVESESEVVQLCLTLCDPMKCVAHQVPLSMEFFRQEYWSGLPFLSPGDLPNPGIEPGSPALQADTLPPQPPWKPIRVVSSAYLRVLIFLPVILIPAWNSQPSISHDILCMYVK